MRVQNGIFRHLQSPSTIFGMPPMFASLALGGVFFVGTILTSVITAPVAMLLCIFAMPPALVFTITLRRKDPHCEATLMLPLGFFKGKKNRTLVAGGAGRGDKEEETKMNILLSSVATLGFAGGAALYANKLLRQGKGGAFEEDWLADELDFDTLLEDRSTVSLKSGKLFRVFKLKGISYDTMNFAEQDSLCKQRSNIFHQLALSGTAFRLLAVKRLKDISFDAEWPSPALEEIGKGEQALFKRAYSMGWYVVLEAQTFEAIGKHTKTILNGFKNYNIELMQAAGTAESVCELTAFLTYLVCGQLPENIGCCSRAINENLPVCDLIVSKEGDHHHPDAAQISS